MRYIAKNIITCTFFLTAIILSCKKEIEDFPLVTTLEVWNISQRSARSGGEVIDSGGATIIARGICWNKSSSPTISNNHTTQNGGIGTFSSNLNGLTIATQYYVRAYATNKYGTGYGNEVVFESGPVQIAQVGTDRISSINSTTAVSGGIIYYDGGASITSKGICWSTTTGPILENSYTAEGTGTEHFVSKLTGLSGNTTYYVRAYAANSAGKAYGNELSFRTISDSASSVLFSPVIFNANLGYAIVTDADYNVYKTVQIGTQTWMAENLKTILFNNGAQIANVDEISIWPNYTLDAYCWYKNDIAFKTNYGALYNWYAVSMGKLCPVGWHVPSETELTTLITFLGGESDAGGKLKENGTVHWLTPNAGAENESGFSALPGGNLSSGGFSSFRSAGYWWSSTEASSTDASFMLMGSDNETAGINSGAKSKGMSVRCIKD